MGYVGKSEGYVGKSVGYAAIRTHTFQQMKSISGDVMWYNSSYFTLTRVISNSYNPIPRCAAEI